MLIQFLSVIGILKIELFFSISSLIGYVHLGRDNSQIFTVMMTAMGIINMAVVLFYIYKDKNYSLKALILMILLPLLVSISFVLPMLEFGFEYYIARYYFWFLAYVMPAIFIGYYCGQHYLESSLNLTPFIELSMLVLTAATIMSTIVPMVEGANFTTFGGESGQTASYNGAFAFGMNLYYLFWGKHHRRIRIMNTIPYKIFQIILLPIQVTAVIIPGGRGGFVLLFSYLAIIFSVALVYGDWKKVFTFLVCIGSLAAFFLLFYKKLIEVRVFAKGISRATEFFSFKEGINWAGTSGRYEWYKEAWELFKKSPIFGHGLYSYLYVYSHKQYPHNIILEILVQGGILYLIAWLSFAVWLLRKYINVVRFKSHLREIFFLCVFPITLLMFSKSYLFNAIFWFFIAYIVSINTTINNKKTITAMLESKGELIEEIPLFKLNVNSQEWWTHLADRFHEFNSKSAYRAFAFYSEIQNSGVTTILINIANVLTDKKKRVLVITTDIPNGYDIKHKVNPAVSILFIKQFEQQQIETAGISYDNFDYVFIDCKPYQNPIEVLQFGIKYDSVVLVVRTGISNVQKTIKQIETFVDRDMQCNIILNGTFKIHMANHIPYKNKDIHQLGSYRRSYKQLKGSQS